MKKFSFKDRHNGSDEKDIKAMLKVIKVNSLSILIKKIVSHSIFLKESLRMAPGKSEYIFLRSLKKLAKKNKIFKSYIGMGYHDCITPSVLSRNILENPGWYTAYTPYQAEISQGRLEMLLNFQTMITDLTAMEIANASLLDEATAAAESMNLLWNTRSRLSKKNADIFVVENNVHPQTIDVLITRSKALPFKLKIENARDIDLSNKQIFGVLLQYPDTNGNINDWTDFTKQAQYYHVGIAIGTDLLSLTLFKAPGEMEADVVFGSTQRFGLRMGFGGPHAAFFATRDKYKRQIPGRIIGISKDAEKQLAYRMALQTREQHIRRDKATSNICTAQVLPAVIATAYAIWHGSEGLKSIAFRIYTLTKILKENLSQLGIETIHKSIFDTIKINLKKSVQITLKEIALKKKFNFRYFEDGCIGISLNETTSPKDIKKIAKIIHKAFHLQQEDGTKIFQWKKDIAIELPSLKRKSTFLTCSVFNNYHTEHEMLRYLKRMENKDISLTHNMIPLGSCTMKLNAATEMIPLTWSEFTDIHPFVPENQAQGYHKLFNLLIKQICRITGFEAVSLQPNSGAQGEYAGLMAIKAYFEDINESYRNIAIIPESAHGTNPASAVMAGMKLVIVKCDEKGNIDLSDLKEKVTQYGERIAVLMITYPSTHGVFEEKIQEICELIHQNRAKVYMDGANMNAQVGLTNPAHIGADICHLNLHKTFCIPHGGGGPGMGPIAATKSLAPFLPSHFHLKKMLSTGSVSAAPWGSASILTISYAYLTMMGEEGLKRATELAILNANYIKASLEKYYKILYVGANGYVAHEMIIDCRDFKKVNIQVEDIAKRLIDYGYHAPTVSFPIPGTLMIEPTESESKSELDFFCKALISIRKEIKEIEEGKIDKINNVLKNAPHTAEMLTSSWGKTIF